MTSSPERTVRRVHSARGFVAADTAPAPAPRVFVATPVAAPAAGAAQRFEAYQVPGRPDEAVVKVREAAKAAGYAQGWAAGLAQAAERAAVERAVEREMADLAARNAELHRVRALARAQDAVLAAARGLLDREDPHVGALADTVLELALDLAGAVLDRELSLTASPALDAVQRALRPLDPDQPVTVRVHPEDLSVLQGDDLKRTGGPAEAPSVSFASSVRFTADPTLQPGDAVAVQGDTEVDARLRASVSRALEALVGTATTAGPATVQVEVPGQVL